MSKGSPIRTLTGKEKTVIASTSFLLHLTLCFVLSNQNRAAVKTSWETKRGEKSGETTEKKRKTRERERGRERDANKNFNNSREQNLS